MIDCRINYSFQLYDTANLEAYISNTETMYTVGHKNTPKFFCHNFYNTRPILLEIDTRCLG